MNIELIKESIAAADVVSFDIFDTLIFRIVNEPEDIFTLIGYILNIKDFKEIRQKGQQMASMKVEREYGFPHADIDEIYEYIKQTSDMKVDWEYVKNYELEMELDSLVCNKEILEVYKFAKNSNKRVIATSDMYIKSKDVKRFLDKCGFSDFDEIYVSADLRKTKYVGDIFDEILNIEKIKPNQMLHIGDNFNSDFTNSSSKGIKAIHYKCNQFDEVKMSSDSLNLFNLINHGVLNVVKNNNNNKSFWYYLGARVGGPLYIGLLNWMEKCLEKEEYDNIYFLSRDGYILHNIFKELNFDNIHYMYASRRALLLAGIDKLDEESLNNLPPYTYGQQVKDILEYLNIEDIEQNTLRDAGFNSVNDIISTRADFDKMKRLFSLNEKSILKNCKEERENAIKYFENLNFLSSNSVIFDCGWNGSSQYLLDKLLDKCEYHKKNKFIYAGIMNNDKSKRQLRNKSFESYLFGHEFNYNLEQRVVTSIVLLELFFGAPHSSVWRYGENGPELEEIEPSHDHKQDIFEGILSYVKEIYGFAKKYNIEIKPEDALRGIFKLIEEPTEEEAVKIGNLPNVDGFVAQKNEMKYIAKLKLGTLFKNIRTEIYWPQALIARKDINPIVKYFVKKKFHLKKIKSERKVRSMRLYNKMPHIKKGLSILKDEGIITFLYKLYRKLKNRKNTDNNEYYKWIKDNESDIFEKRELSFNPLISIVVPVYNVLDEQLVECIESVINQTYDNWQLCLVDDASTWNSVVKVLNKYEKNTKINIVYRKENGHISRATNDGISIANGEFIAFLDCDDVLAPNAVYEVAKKLNEDSEYDFIYSDEDKLTADGKHRHSPFFKPDWSPDTFMSLMYTCHFSVYRKSIIDEIDGLRTEFNGAQDYDFTLRFTEKAKKIGHIDKILYHWREREESIASNPEAKPYALQAVKRCKEEALERRGLKGTVEYVNDMFQYRVKYTNDEKPLVSIIIPSKDNFKILNNCIESVKKYTSYYNYEIVVVDNGSNNENKNKYEDICKKYNCRYHYEKMNFNFSKMCNIGSRIAKGKFYLFLNDDIEIFQEEWLEIMLGQASLKHVGAVGAKLLYPNSNIIQHIGITNLKIGPSHSQIGFDDRIVYYYGRNRMEYNFIAVTGACLMIERHKFEEISGFDENLSVAYNDVDLCFKLVEHKYYNVVRNDVSLYHHESISRGIDDINKEKMTRLLKERKILFDKHKQFKGWDPFYNTNLTECKVDYDIKYKPEFNKMLEINIEIKNKWVSNACKACIDSINVGSNIRIEGWAFIEGIRVNNLNSKKIVLIDEESNNSIFSTDVVIRKDVTSVMKKQGNLNLSGFSCTIDSSLLTKKTYKVGLLLENKLLHKKKFIITDKKINLQ
ncbi:hypothetical protein C1H57_18805 [Clostridium sp. 2-1]|uniref:glycosyltransferase n=1 Tax=Clostridium TaxID=1485 RepID=UPI000CDA5E9B|nr:MULTISPECIES: glycosyltransferase [Clostridium]MBN7573239.1 glycosyltransferase [Clostridium beijerinckii]MBN7578578.1 glycosyltransferase [Clostridium beijerinckii]MBN7583013.1 glycosyltransferase [Clostridium beijerinckii]MBO0519184.1 glycosyltransferase [Clostridium beijerinckii]POO89787.1 hypothetical protein C1H57_18805 [Clostridium sp. 2-1]